MQAQAKARPKPGAAPPALPTVRLLTAAAGAAASRATTHATTARELQRARTGHSAEAHRLANANLDARGADQEQLRRRIAGHLELDRGSAPAPAPVDRERTPPAPAALPWPTSTAIGGTSAAEARGEPAPGPAAPASRVETALQLVQRIEVFLRSGRPQLELTVGGAFSAEVLLERTGPGEVAITIRGRRGPPPPAELSRVRDHLRARGLKLSSLALR